MTTPSALLVKKSIMASPVTCCPPSQLLVEFSVGRLDEASAETLYQHLETCVICRATVAKVPPDGFVDLVIKVESRGESDRSSAFDDSSEVRISKDGVAFAAGDNYEVVRALGRGGMGVVYLARNLMLDRLEVLKAVDRALLARPGVIERFEREVRAAARLSDPNVVTIYSATRIGEQLVLAMEYVAGQNLADEIAHSGPLDVEQAADYIAQAALGLEHAHQRGMVHRDIKPGNLMLTETGGRRVVKILDFGLAKVASEATQKDQGLTQSGQILGTPAYLAPEQTLSAARADIRADIYSLGCTLYCLLAGHPPFEADSVYEVMHAHQHVVAPPLDALRPDVPTELATIAATMMAKDPEVRFQSPGDVAAALARFLACRRTGQLHSPPIIPSDISPSGLASRLSASVLASFGLVALLVGGFAAALHLPLRSKTFLDSADSLTTVSLPTLLSIDKNLPPPAIAPFDADRARAHQAAWAAHLGRSVEEINSLGIKLVLIPPGEFTMGGSQAEIETVARLMAAQSPNRSLEPFIKLYSIEMPKHRVAISRPFLLATTELTVGQFRQFAEATAFESDAERSGGGARIDFDRQGTWIEHDAATKWSSPLYEVTDDHPVSVVSWNDAVQFCNWLSAQEKLTPCYLHSATRGWILAEDCNGYRLPTEAEWEFACRAGTPTRYSFGDNPSLLCEYGWCWPVAQGAERVATLKPNAFGLYDMHANVSEWCHDRFLQGYYSVSPEVDPQGPAAGGLHAHRGGDWHYGWDIARASFRRIAVSTRGQVTLGFRVARAATGAIRADSASRSNSLDK